MVAAEISDKHHIKILQDFQVFLRGIWVSNKKRDWTPYTIDRKSQFWDNRDVVDQRK